MVGRPDGSPGEAATAWWLDTERPLTALDGGTYVPVQTRAGIDANDYRRIECGMRLLFTDQAEYYFVCPRCFERFSGQQWSGSTRGRRGWRERAELQLLLHQLVKGWCEFCDPVFGNGGWC
jgi:hypothetical protein